MKRTRGKSFPVELSNQILVEVTKQCSRSMKLDFKKLIADPTTVVIKVLEKGFEVNWDQVSQITDTPKRKCYKHFNETIMPKVMPSDFSAADEKFIIKEMHAAIARGQQLNNDVLDKYIKPLIGEKYLKVTLLRKFNNLKRTRDIVLHQEEYDKSVKNLVHTALKKDQITQENPVQLLSNVVQPYSEVMNQYELSQKSNQQNMISQFAQETRNFDKNGLLSQNYLLSRTDEDDTRKLVLLATSALQGDYDYQETNETE